MNQSNSMLSESNTDVLPNVMHKGTGTGVKLKQYKVGKRYNSNLFNTRTVGRVHESN